MNIALSAVIISILLIPPVVFYLSLYIGRFPRAIPKFSLFEGILASAVISLLIHAIAISLIPSEIRFDILIKVLGGDLKDVENTIKNPDLKKAVTDFAIYNAALLLIMVGLGRVVRWRLLASGLHLRNEVFNLYNKWWYFFNGNYADIAGYDLVFIDAVVDTKDGTMVYSGFLVNFETKGGELDRIYLKDAVRREFKKYANSQTLQLANEPGEPVQIPGATFSIKYENVINLNVNFIVIEEEENQLDNDLPIL
jgi:hypothetical protein